MVIKKILVADDELLIRNFLKDVLIRKNFEVDIAKNGKEAIELLKIKAYDLVITDLKMPFKNGIEVLKFAKNLSPNILVIIITAFGTIENAVEAMKLGAFNYLIKPFSCDAIEDLIEKAKEHINLLKKDPFLKNKAFAKNSKIITNSPSMQKILKTLEKIAKSSSSVFISGESGTGKEVIAQAIHSLSLREKKPFIKVNCAAISDSLIESEFFGHEKGSFTGAENKRIGRFELADKGTLLLDEITEIPISLQPKLLRAIQEKEFERVGGTNSIKVDIRIISTSNRDMKEAIEKNIFREDLFFRLNVIPLKIPPLRERKEDIIPLSKHFIEIFSKRDKKPKKPLSKNAEKKLLNYSFPGNIRELKNIIERTLVLDSSNIIEEENLYLDEENKNVKTEKILNKNVSLHEMEKIFILKMLKEQKFNKTTTAKILKITTKTLRNKIKEYKINA